MGDMVLRLQGVSKSFGEGAEATCALDEISLDIHAGEVSGLIGPDGAGKTTLMRLCAALMLPDQGQIEALGLDVLAQPQAIQSRIGYMPQRFGLYEDLTVQENLDLYADLQGLAVDQRQSRYRRLMEMTGLAPFTARLAGKLSGGMKQKLGLACALLREPPLLLLDEPTVGVDPLSRRELWEIVYTQVRESGMSVLLSTAYLDEAERCDRVALLHRGRLLGVDRPAAFSGPLQGDCFELSVPANISARRLQRRLQEHPSIADALIEGERLRVVRWQDKSLPADLLAPEVPQLDFVPVDPIFEDAFIRMLRSPDDSQPSLPEMNPATDTTEPRDNIISAHELERRFGDFRAVKGISFSVDRGEIFGLLGANGAGKSTTFRMLCGLLPVSDGQLSVAGQDLRHAAARARQRIGYMAQKFSLYGNLTVIQNLGFFAAAYGLRGRRRQARIDWALDNFELRAFAGHNAAELSLGHKQRLAFAAALMHEPEILFLDEPTSGVDPLARREFWARTNALAETGITVLVTTHFMQEANYCDRLVIMAEGEVLAQGTPQEIKHRTRRPGEPEPSMEDAFIALIEQHGAVA
jgi:ABC-2 type transport system ATP-binding protein